MSKANAALGSAMGVTRFPCCQLFRSMKVLHSTTDCSADALSAALAQHSSSPSAVDASSNPAEGRQQPAGALNGHAEGAANGGSANGGPGGSTSGKAEAGVSSSGIYDPPAGKEARAGATRIMPGGNNGYFWCALARDQSMHVNVEVIPMHSLSIKKSILALQQVGPGMARSALAAHVSSLCADCAGAQSLLGFSDAGFLSP